jgi:uncharacterized small protein (TIGR04563 family)
MQVAWLCDVVQQVGLLTLALTNYYHDRRTWYPGCDDTKLKSKDTFSMPGSDKRKQSLYFPEEMLGEIQEEAARQDRSLSWIVQKAWKIARREIMKYPSVNEFPGEEDTKESSR